MGLKNFINEIRREKAKLEVAEHLIEQDRRDRELEREIRRYLIERDKKEKLYERIFVLILFLLVFAVLLTMHIVKNINPELLGLVLFAILFGASLYAFLERIQKSSLDNRLSSFGRQDTQEMLKQWADFFESGRNKNPEKDMQNKNPYQRKDKLITSESKWYNSIWNIWKNRAH
ncbi:MAG: hypothetical protein DRI57_03310 [Deltaproteobacteria bacterium]|nr:MAG: hypothetical protein DRI57_03310 [Deltaproteobacteria bacterium]